MHNLKNQERQAEFNIHMAYYNRYIFSIASFAFIVSNFAQIA